MKNPTPGTIAYVRVKVIGPGQAFGAERGVSVRVVDRWGRAVSPAIYQFDEQDVIDGMTAKKEMESSK